MMELDEAIKHCHDKAKELREQPLKEKMDIEDIASCEECAEEHEQLAEWLEELKEWKASASRPVCKYTYADGYLQGYIDGSTGTDWRMIEE